MPPFRLAELQASIAKHFGAKALSISPEVIHSIADTIFHHYASGGPAGATWHAQRVTEQEGPKVGFDLCRGEWNGGICFSQYEEQVKALADALNELEGIASDASGNTGDKPT